MSDVVSRKEPTTRKVAELEKRLKGTEMRIGLSHYDNGIRLKDALEIIDVMRDDFFAMQKTETVNAWVGEYIIKWLGAKPREESE